MADNQLVTTPEAVAPLRVGDLKENSIPVPPPIAVGPLYEFFYSGDRWLTTPSPYNGGALGSGLGTVSAIETSDWFGEGWNTRAVDPWPAFGGTAYLDSFYMINHPSPDAGFLLSAAVCGNFKIPGICDPGLPFAAQAMLSSTWLRLEFTPWTGGDTTFGIDLWGDYRSTDPFDPTLYTVEIPTSAVTGAANADSLACIPIWGQEFPTAVAVWSTGGSLYAVSYRLEMSTAHLIWNRHPHLTIVAGTPVRISSDFTKGSAGLDLAWCPGSGGDPICVAWRSSLGISVGALTLDGDGQPRISSVSTPLAGGAAAVDVGWVSEGFYAVIRGTGRSGTPAGSTPAYAVLDLTSGEVQASGTIAGLTQVRGTTVAGRVAVLGRDGTRWSLRISSATFDSFTSFDGGPTNTESTPLHGVDLLGHPDGRLITHVRSRYQQYGTLSAPLTWTWAALMLWTFDPESGALTQRDAVEPPFGDDYFSNEIDTPLRLTAQTDRLFGIEQGGTLYGGQNSPITHVVSWAGMVPNFWFMQMHPIGGNRFVVSWTPTDFEQWGSTFVDGSGTQTAAYRQALFAFEINERGVITDVSNAVFLHDIALNFEIPVAGDGTGNRFWAMPTYKLGRFSSPMRLALHTFDIDNSFVLTEVNEVTVEEVSQAGFSNGGTFGTAVYMGGGVVVIPWGSFGLRAIRINEDGTVASYADSPLGAFQFQLLSGGFNDTSGCAMKRVGDTNFFAAIGFVLASGTYLPSSALRQLCISVYELNPLTLALEESSATRPWMVDSPDAPCDYLGFSNDSAGAAEFDFSADGRNMAFPIETTIGPLKVPWGTTTPGAQAWYPEDAADGLQQFGLISISDLGQVSVEYLPITADFQGTQLPAQPGEGPGSGPDPAGPAIRVFQAFGGDFLRIGTLVATISDRQIVVSGYVDGDVRANADVFINQGGYHYVMGFARQGATMHLESITPQWLSDGWWHGGVRSVEGGALIWYDGDPHHTSRCDTRGLNTDSFGTHLRLIGAARGRGTGRVVEMENRVRSYPGLIE